MIEQNAIVTARNVPIIDWLAAAGYDATPGRNKLYFSPFRDEKTPSFHIDTRKNVWFDHGLGRGGDVIALVQQLTGKGLRDAVAELNGHTPTFSAPTTFKHEGHEKEYKARRNLTVTDLANARLLEYASRRGISANLLRKYCQQVEYEYTDKYGRNNCAYCIGFASDNGGWELRAPSRYSTDPDDEHTFKGGEGAKGITTLIVAAAADTYVFEGFFTFLSFMALKGAEAARANIIVLNSVCNTQHAIAYLSSHNELTGVVRLCLDNDKAGDEHTQELLDAIPAAVDARPALLHGCKDLNELLMGKPPKAGYIDRAPFMASNSPAVAPTAPALTTTPANRQTPDVGQIIVCPTALTPSDIAAGVLYHAAGLGYTLTGYQTGNGQHWEGWCANTGYYAYDIAALEHAPANALPYALQRIAGAILSCVLSFTRPPKDLAGACSKITEMINL